MIPGIYIARLLELLEARGHAAADLLDVIGLPRDALGSASTYIELAPAMQLLARAATLAGDRALGLELGLAMKPTAHGWYGLAFLTSSTIRDAFELTRRYFQVRGSPLTIELTAGDELATLSFTDALPHDAARQLLIDLILGASVGTVEVLLGQALPESELVLTFDEVEPPYHARFRDRLPRISYGAAVNAARFPVAWLDRPLQLADALARREAVAALENELRMTGAGGWVDRTRAVLADPSHAFPDLETVAAKLAVSARMLRRHLQQQGTTFQALRDDARRARAILLLERTTTSIDAIARELGYGDAAAFTRAFQRWTGRAPSSYRR